MEHKPQDGAGRQRSLNNDHPSVPCTVGGGGGAGGGSATDSLPKPQPLFPSTRGGVRASGDGVCARVRWGWGTRTKRGAARRGALWAMVFSPSSWAIWTRVAILAISLPPLYGSIIPCAQGCPGRLGLGGRGVAPWGFRGACSALAVPPTG